MEVQILQLKILSLFIAQNGPIYPQNPTPNDAYPQAPYTNPVQQDPNQTLIYQQPYQNPIIQGPNQM